MSKLWAILPAAGSGSRLQAELPKQYLPLLGREIIRHSIERLLALQDLEKIVVVLAPEDPYWSTLELNDPRLLQTTGAAQRQQSVLNGLLHLPAEAADEDWVLVHDAARPCVRVNEIENLIAAVADHAVGGLLGWPVDNTLKRVNARGEVSETIARENCWNAATPQLFRLGLLRGALQNLAAQGETVTDEAAAMESQGYKPLLVPCSRDNIKVTHQQDLALAGFILQQQEHQQ